jgi:hypothetical protein
LFLGNGKRKTSSLQIKKIKEAQQQLVAIYEIMEKEEVTTAHLEKRKRQQLNSFS